MNLKDFITKQTSNRHFDEFVFLLPDSYKGNFIKFLDDYEVALKEEYAGAELAEIAFDDWNAPYFDGQMLQFNATEVGTYVVVFTSNTWINIGIIEIISNV